jgi:hypothetical protein
MMTAFFMERKETGFISIETAMAWVDQQAAKFGMRGHEAEAKGYAQIFRN